MKVFFFPLLKVIRKSQCLDEVLAKLDPQAAHNHFKAVKKWKAKHEHSSPRDGAFLLFSQKKLAKVMAEVEGQLGELVNGRNGATLQVMSHLKHLVLIESNETYYGQKLYNKCSIFISDSG